MSTLFKRVMLLGGVSQLGYALVRQLEGRLTPYCSRNSRHRACLDWPRIELEDPDSIRQAMEAQHPDLVIHCGGICDVDRCEARPAFAWQINVASVEMLLEALPPRTRLVYCSSDHVFGGGRGPYTEDAPHRPVSVYGTTRSVAESLIAAHRPECLILRHGLSIGPSISGRSGHLDWLTYRTGAGLPTTVVVDEVRSVVWADDLARRVWDLAHSGLTGTRHITAEAPMNRLELARYLDRRFALGARLAVARREERPVPHIGDVELATIHVDELARPLPAVQPVAATRS